MQPPVTPVTIGETYVFFIPPGWLIAGTVTGFADDGTLTHIRVKDAVFLEGVHPGKCTISDLPKATTPEEQRAVVRVSWPLPDTVFAATQFMAFRCNLPMTGLLSKEAK
jgi:hypothetical protein